MLPVVPRAQLQAVELSPQADRLATEGGTLNGIQAYLTSPHTTSSRLRQSCYVFRLLFSHNVLQVYA